MDDDKLQLIAGSAFAVSQFVYALSQFKTCKNLLKSQFAQLRDFSAPVRILAFLLLLALLWLPFAAPFALWSRDPNQTTIVVMLLLFVEFVGLMRWWGQEVYHDRQIFQTYGLSFSLQMLREGLQGFSWGVVSLALMFLLQSGFGWLVWQTPAANFGRIALEGLLVALLVGLAEELVFRGWILEELQRDYNLRVSLWANSLLFATLHFLKPLPEVIRLLPQFLGLVLLGMILIWMKQTTRKQQRSAVRLITHSGRLGLPIGFHAGLIWGYYLLKVGGLVALTDQVPEWVTGIDGNPLAGIVGVLFLSGLAIYWRWRLKHN